MTSQLAQNLRRQAAHGNAPSPEQLKTAADALEAVSSALQNVLIALKLNHIHNKQPPPIEAAALANAALRKAGFKPHGD